jgi:hypothetical protein
MRKEPLSGIVACANESALVQFRRSGPDEQVFAMGPGSSMQSEANDR